MTATLDGRRRTSPLRSNGDESAVLPVVIIGAGFSGIGMAIRLLQQGVEDLVVLERADSLGGTWRDNSYPGAACDVMSLLYSYSFAPNTEWSTTFGKQAEILAYLKRCADTFGVTPKIHFGQELLGADWDDTSATWSIRATDHTLRAKVLVSATGYLSDPTIPDLEGIHDFTGRLLHTSQWDDNVEVAGKRVAVVGTGASAIQIVPRLQPQVEALDVYQRTPAWVAPKPDRAVTGRERWARRHVRGYQALRRGFNKWGREVLIPMLSKPEVMEKTLQANATKMLAEQVSDETLRQQLTPDYTIGCKRILFSNAYYPALAAENSTLVPSGVTRFTPSGVVAGGVERRTDVVVLATGFQATSRPVADRICGRGGETLAESWSTSMSAYLGTTVHGFPNLFLMLGPNTALGHSSQTVMIEAQIGYILDALRVMQERGLSSVEVRRPVQESFVAWLGRRFEGTVWQTGGCQSWYQDVTGHNPSIWPTFTWTFRRRTSSFRPGDYHLVSSPVTASDPVVTPSITRSDKASPTTDAPAVLEEISA